MSDMNKLEGVVNVEGAIGHSGEASALRIEKETRVRSARIKSGIAVYP